VFPLALALLLVVSGCSSREPVAVRVTIPDLEGTETPVPGLVLTFVPYDRDSVIRALEARAGSRPHTRELDSLFRRFRGPFTEYVKLLARIERLESAERRLAAGGASAELTAVRDSLAALRPAVAERKVTLDRVRAETWPRIDSLRREVKAWESHAYEGYDQVVKGLREKAFVNAVADTTDAGGWGSIVIPKGAWWVTTRTIDPADPNAEWYWNVRIRGDTVRLDPRTGSNRPRY
jgi:hypothetical protein